MIRDSFEKVSLYPFHHAGVRSRVDGSHRKTERIAIATHSVYERRLRLEDFAGLLKFLQLAPQVFQFFFAPDNVLA